MYMVILPSLGVPHIVVFVDPGRCCCTHRPQEDEHSPFTAPVFAALCRIVNDKLSGCAGVHGGHETLLDTKQYT